jgi:hypothetical protein
MIRGENAISAGVALRSLQGSGARRQIPRSRALLGWFDLWCRFICSENKECLCNPLKKASFLSFPKP